MATETRLLRSWMFVPGHKQKMIDKSFGLTSVDAVMLDIEDGVAPAEKDAARQQIASSLDAIAQARHYVLFEIYLCESGAVATRFIDALARP